MCASSSGQPYPVLDERCHRSTRSPSLDLYRRAPLPHRRCANTGTGSTRWKSPPCGPAASRSRSPSACAPAAICGPAAANSTWSTTTRHSATASSAFGDSCPRHHHPPPDHRRPPHRAGGRQPAGSAGPNAAGTASSACRSGSPARLRSILVPSPAPPRTTSPANSGVRRPVINVVPLGVDTDCFHPRPDITRVPGRIVSVASADSPLKGVAVLLRARRQTRHRTRTSN